ncbi:MAG: type II toxin-antitoxin system mRNA interferase toxin, RelE/StbE family [Gammaproteobacteria bacterium HGW-Gammaproteobacteria-2]|jgi:addiction module RelE/StbE family toxin|nr:MAG: type II toxin-antitoxin system mRNA interferase toxin, RelE/StbE family [Gammaproteobacteria bacterium HGW-Gammaproteobacteria-2]
MARGLVWSPEALEDVEQIAAYIARDSEWYAQAVVRHLVEAAESLHELPNRGQVVPEVQREAFREIFVDSYRLIYRVEATQVTVIAVMHGHRLLGPLLEHVPGEI